MLSWKPFWICCSLFIRLHNGTNCNRIHRHNRRIFSFWKSSFVKYLTFCSSQRSICSHTSNSSPCSNILLPWDSTSLRARYSHALSSSTTPTPARSHYSVNWSIQKQKKSQVCKHFCEGFNKTTEKWHQINKEEWIFVLLIFPQRGGPPLAVVQRHGNPWEGWSKLRSTSQFAKIEVKAWGNSPVEAFTLRRTVISTWS